MELSGFIANRTVRFSLTLCMGTALDYSQQISFLSIGWMGFLTGAK